MENPSQTARSTWRDAIYRFTLDAFTGGRDTAITYVVPATDFTITDIQEALTADELPVGAVVLHDLCHLTIQPCPDVVVLPVNRSASEVTCPRLSVAMAGEAKALADHLMARAWAQRMEGAVRRALPTPD